MKGNELACIIRNTVSKSRMGGWGCGWCGGGEGDEEKERCVRRFLEKLKAELNM